MNIECDDADIWKLFESLDILNDGQTLVSASGDKTIKFWNWTSGQVLNTINTNLQIRSLAVINAISEFIFFK